MKDTKRTRITRALKQLALTRSGGVSRSEAAETLQIDLRTASCYLEQLAESGLLRSETVLSGGKGRPHTVYRSNASNLTFLGIQLTGRSGSAVLVDSVGRTLSRGRFELPENGSRLSLFSAIMDIVSRYKQFENRSLYGVGLAISRWLQPPLAGEDVFANLADYLERECKVAVYRDVNINAASFAISKTLNCRNLAVIHTGNVIEFGLVLDGMPDADFHKREAWLSHLCVNPDGRRCYCGKYGCLENYVTTGARNERLHNGNRHATLRALGGMLGAALVRVAKKYPVEAIQLVGADELFPAAEEYFMPRVNNSVSLVVKHSQLEVDYGAALESAYYELYRFTGEH